MKENKLIMKLLKEKYGIEKFVKNGYYIIK